MTPDLPPLPDDDSDLEDLMSRHLDYRRPDPELREASLGRLREALPSGKAGRAPRSGRASGRAREAGSPVLALSLVSCGLILLLGLFLFWSNTQAPPAPNEPALWNRAKTLEEEGMSAYHEFVKGRQSSMSLEEQDYLRSRALEKLGAALEQMNAVLDPKRDEAGILPSEFEGYEEDLSRIATYLVDLEKLAPLAPNRR